MIAHNPKSLCREAELYYYDFLCDESRVFIPESIVNHIEQCQRCLGQIKQLETTLSQADGLESEQEQVSSAITTMLKLHFAYIGESVTCNIVKPFLPTLLDRVLGVRIPTPIVTHMRDCQQCSEDLDIIRGLKLSRKQLCRLSQLFADKPARSNVSCIEAQNAIPLVVSMVFSEINSEVLKHLCTCPTCRRLVYKERQKLYNSLPEYTPSVEFPCESVSASSFFDYVVPYGIDPANDQYVKFRESFASHVTNCPSCLYRMQQLHQTVYGIAERAESDVVTIHHIDESAKVEAASESDDIYAGFPIRVETANREDVVNARGAASIIDFGTALRRKISAEKLKPLLKTAIPAAAIILIAAVLVFNIPAAKAVTLEKIYDAIEKVRNAYVASFMPYEKEPVQELWISRTMNIYMAKTAEQCFLWDIVNGVAKIKYLDIGTAETTHLTAENIADIEKKISGPLGLMPFYNISSIPEGAGWNRVADKDLEAATKGIEIYDLTWPERAYDGSAISKKWRFFVNIKGNLPQKIEIYQMLPTNTEYILMLLMTVEYLSDSEIQGVVKEAPF